MSEERANYEVQVPDVERFPLWPSDAELIGASHEARRLYKIATGLGADADRRWEMVLNGAQRGSAERAAALVLYERIQKLAEHAVNMWLAATRSDAEWLGVLLQRAQSEEEAPSDG